MHTLSGTTPSLPVAKDIENNVSLSNRLLENFLPDMYLEEEGRKMRLFQENYFISLLTVFLLSVLYMSQFF